MDSNINPIHQVTDLLNGMTEAELEHVGKILASVIRVRRTQRAAETARTLTPGTRVKLTGNLKPAYLLGLTGTVQDFPIGDRVTLKMDNPAAAPRYTSSATGELKAPLTCVEVID